MKISKDQACKMHGNVLSQSTARSINYIFTYGLDLYAVLYIFAIRFSSKIRTCVKSYLKEQSCNAEL